MNANSRTSSSLSSRGIFASIVRVNGRQYRIVKVRTTLFHRKERKMRAGVLAVALVLSTANSAAASTPHWGQIDADNYRMAYGICRLEGVAKVASAYHTKHTASAAAVGYARGMRPGFRAPVEEGCLGGLLHLKPLISNTWPHHYS